MNKILVLLILFPLSLLAQEAKLNIPLDTNTNHHFHDTDLLPVTFFTKNRQALRDLMPKNSVAVLFANPVRNRSNDVDFEYHQDPNFYYLTGLTEPHAAVIIYKEDQEFKDDLKTNEILFLQKKDQTNERWTGKRLGIDEALKELEFQTAMENEKFLLFENDYEKFDKVLSFKSK